MKLGEKQELFARLQPLLFLYAVNVLGFQIRPKELQRSPEAAKWNSEHCRRCKEERGTAQHVTDHAFIPIGIKNSVHCDGLAIDIVISREGMIQRETSSYEGLGDYWKSLHEFCCWGGDFTHKDGGHFSVTHGGRR